jgi:hypothetical protein
MPALSDRKKVRSEEQIEATLTGPFGGIQSELPSTEIESIGFLDANNIIFRKGTASPRPGLVNLPALPSPSNEPIMGIYQFYNVNGQRIQGVMTPTRLLQFVSGAWVNITGPGFTGTATQLFSWDVLNYKLCFSQGSDPLMMWDGIAGSYTQVAGSPTKVKYVAEVGLHLIVVDPDFPNRYYWSGVGDPTDWTGLTSGLNDIVGNLGPINFVIKINQYGFGFHQLGITQIVPTGIGTNPFAFSSAANASIGTLAPFSVDHMDDHGREFSVHVGKDNVYAFDSSSVEQVGDYPMSDGTRRRVGARARIMADLLLSNPVMVKGYCTYLVNGQPFRSYWLNMPHVALWVLNFDEGNWTRFTYTDTVNDVGPFTGVQTVLRIMDLVGTIAAQSWSPATLPIALDLDGILLGFIDGVTAYNSLGVPCELAATLTSGKLIFGDRRHKHSTKKFRVSFVDQGPVNFSLQLSNESGFSETHSFSVGTGSGDVLNYIQEYKVTGLRLQYTLTIPANSPTGIVELAPMIDIGGEQRGGLIEN